MFAPDVTHAELIHAAKSTDRHCAPILFLLTWLVPGHRPAESAPGRWWARTAQLFFAAVWMETFLG